MPVLRFNARVERVLVALLLQGLKMNIAARQAGVAPATAHGWLRMGALGDRRFRRLLEAYRAPGQAKATAERELAQRATELLEKGATLRGAARELGATYPALRVLVRRGRGKGARWTGDATFRRLALAAARRERGVGEVCPHCHKPLPRREA